MESDLHVCHDGSESLLLIFDALALGDVLPDGLIRDGLILCIE